MSSGSVRGKLDPEEVVALLQTRPVMIVYRGDYDFQALHQRIGALSREIAGKLPSSGKRLACLDVVLYSVLNVLAERYSSEHITQDKTFAVFNKESTEAAYDLLASSLRSDPELALALSSAWNSKLLNFLHDEAAKFPKMHVDNFVFDAAESFRITALLAARVLKSLSSDLAQKGLAGISDKVPRKGPPLTAEELADIHRGIEEIKAGKAKHFRTIDEALVWLHRGRKISPEGTETPEPFHK